MSIPVAFPGMEFDVVAPGGRVSAGRHEGEVYRPVPGMVIPELVWPRPAGGLPEMFMAAAKKGDTVLVQFRGFLDDGTVFDSTEGRDPLQFTIGDGSILPGFELAVMGLEVGETSEVAIPWNHAYGPHHEEMVVVVERGQFWGEISPAPGDALEIRQPDGKSVVVIVTEVGESTVTIDANHPLAGKHLTFHIELLEIL